MGHFREHSSDLLGEACDRLAALELVFFDRTSLNLNQQEIGGIISGFWDIQDILGDIRQSTRANAAPDRGEAADHQPRRAPEPSERVALYPDYQTKLRAEKDIAMIKHLSRAADKLLLEGATDKGADSDTTEAVWAFVDQINEAARRVENVLEVEGHPNWGLPDEGSAPSPNPSANAPQPEQPPAQAGAFSELDAQIEMGRDIKLIRSLSVAANRLFTDDLTNEGGGIELCENVWRFVEQIEAAARRLEGVLYTPRQGRAAAARPEMAGAAKPPRPRPTRAAASGGANLTEEVPPERRRDPDASDTAGRASA